MDNNQSKTSHTIYSNSDDFLKEIIFSKSFKSQSIDITINYFHINGNESHEIYLSKDSIIQLMNFLKFLLSTYNT